MEEMVSDDWVEDVGFDMMVALVFEILIDDAEEMIRVGRVRYDCMVVVDCCYWTVEVVVDDSYVDC